MNYTEESAMRALRRKRIDVTVEKDNDGKVIARVITVGEHQHPGNGTWGAIDYLVGYCGYLCVIEDKDGTKHNYGN